MGFRMLVVDLRMFYVGSMYHWEHSIEILVMDLLLMLLLNVDWVDLVHLVLMILTDVWINGGA